MLNVINRIAKIAASLQKKLVILIAVGAVATSILAFKAFDMDSVWWWNVLKMSILFFPALIWAGVIWVLNQLQEAPEIVSSLLKKDSQVLASASNVNIKKPTGLIGLITTIRSIKNHEGLEFVFDAIAGVGLLVNPVFAVVSFFSLIVLFFFIVIAPWMLLF